MLHPILLANTTVLRFSWYYQKAGAAFSLLILDHRPSFGQCTPVCQDSDDEKSESGSETKTTECEKQPTSQLACGRGHVEQKEEKQHVVVGRTPMCYPALMVKIVTTRCANSAACIPSPASAPLIPFDSIPPVRGLVQVVMPGDAKGGRFVRWGGLHGRLCLADGDLALEVIWEEGKNLKIFEISYKFCLDKQILIVASVCKHGFW